MLDAKPVTSDIGLYPDVDDDADIQLDSVDGGADDEDVIVQCAYVPSGVPVHTPVAPKQIRSVKRMNLLVPHSSSQQAIDAGAVFDVVNQVFYVPPRVPLAPFADWTPWDLATVPCDNEGFVAAGVLHAAGEVKKDGSPDFRLAVNREARALTSPTGRGPGSVIHFDVAATPVVFDELPPVETADPPVVDVVQRGLFAFLVTARRERDYVTLCVVSAAVFLVAMFIGVALSDFVRDAHANWTDELDASFPVSNWVASDDFAQRITEPKVQAVGASFLYLFFLVGDVYAFAARFLALVRRFAWQGPARFLVATLVYVYFVRGVFAGDVRGVAAASQDHVGDSFLMSALHVTNNVSMLFSDTVVFDFVPRDRVESLLLSSEFNATEPELVYIVDGGAKRGCIRDLSFFVDGTTRPCPFQIRSVEGSVFTPSVIGTARIPILTEDGTTHYCG